MTDLDKALETQLANIEKQTGKTVTQLMQAIGACGRTKHGEIVAWLKETEGLGHGNANVLAHLALKAAAPAAPAGGDPLDEIYVGKKAGLRPIHEALMAEIESFGAFEVAPKKGYVSLRRAKQFAMLGPKTNDRFELGLNLKAELTSPRIVAQKPGGMCQYVVPLTDAGQVDGEIVAVLRQAYEAAG